MADGLSRIEPVSIEGIELGIVDGRVRFSGVLSMREPQKTVTPFLRQVHAAAVESKLPTVIADFTGLRFMNSSSIRALIDWIDWLRREPNENQYQLRFVVDPNIAWQSATFSVIQSLSEEHVVVERGTGD